LNAPVENAPCYFSIAWALDRIGLEDEAIKKIEQSIEACGAGILRNRAVRWNAEDFSSDKVKKYWEKREKELKSITN
jgi:hypothetical protein